MSSSHRGRPPRSRLPRGLKTAVACVLASCLLTSLALVQPPVTADAATTGPVAPGSGTGESASPAATDTPDPAATDTPDPAATDTPDPAVALPYRQSDQRSLPAGWSATACPAGTLPNLIALSCTDDAIVFTATGYARGVGTQTVVVRIAHGSGAARQTRDLTYRVTLEAPTLDAPKALRWDVPLAQGTPALIPFSTFTPTCEGCAGSGPTYGSPTVSPASAGTLLFSAQGLVFTPSPDFHGTATLGYRITDPFGAESTTTTVSVTVVPGVTRAPAMAPVVVTGARGATLEGSVTANDVAVSGYPVTTGVCGSPANGTVTCTSDGHFVYTPRAGFTGLDEFSYQVFSRRSGDQAIGSIVLAVGAPAGAATTAIKVETSASVTSPFSLRPPTNG